MVVKWLERLIILAAYLALAVASTWPLALHPGSSLLGYPNVDALDTVHLRGAVAEILAHPTDWTSMAAYWPAGFRPLALTPNWLDHLLAAPGVLALPFPLADNLWWLLALTANGLAGHHLGRRLGGTHGAGALVGVAWATSEALLREANLHHAPQAFAPFAPLYLAALLDALDPAAPPAARRGASLRAGALLALASLGYWYNGLFLVVGSAVLVALHGREARRLGPGLLLAAALAVPALAPWLAGWDELPITARAGVAALPVDAPGLEAVPAEQRMAALHGADPLFPFRATPLDRSNRVGLVLIGAALLGARRVGPRARWGLAAMALTGAVFLLGPVLKAGESAVTVGGRTVPLPFAWLGALGPWFARLDWPERWGCLVALGLAALAARAPRPGLLAGALLLEGVLLSGNLPLATQDLSHLEGWRHLARADGAVLELPLARWGLDASVVGLHRRYHRRPSVNPMLLPPGAVPPVAWKTWMEGQPAITWLGALEAARNPQDPDPSVFADLRAAGVAAVAIDAEPLGVQTEGRVGSTRARLTRILGPPDDLGCAIVWWLAPPLGGPPPTVGDGDRWRAGVAARKRARPEPERNTLIRSWRQVLEGDGAAAP